MPTPNSEKKTTMQHYKIPAALTLGFATLAACTANKFNVIATVVTVPPK